MTNKNPLEIQVIFVYSMLYKLKVINMHDYERFIQSATVSSIKSELKHWKYHEHRT